MTPWDVQAGAGGVDYDKLLTAFGCQPIDDALVARVERVTGTRAHVLLRRGMFFAHRRARATVVALRASRGAEGQPCWWLLANTNGLAGT